MSAPRLADPAIDDALQAARVAYAQAHPECRAAHQQAENVLPGGNTRTSIFFEPFPIRFDRGEGCRLWDLEGHEYLDFLGEFTAGLYGHSHPAIRAAVERALATGVNLGGHHPMEARFAAAIRDRFPSMQRLRLTNSGTEANLMALATATVTTGRRTILVFDGGYHGGVFSFAAGPSPVNVPHDVIVATYNDLAGTRGIIEERGAELAAVLVEPMLGSGGCVPGEPEFLHGLRELTSRCGALLVFDEVMTSRLARGGRQAELRIGPDLTTLGKYVGGGMSFGAFGGRADLMSQYDPRQPGGLPHAGTFNNNLLTMFAGVTALTEVLAADPLTEVNARGDDLRLQINRLAEKYDAPVQASGLGSLLNVHFTARPVRTAADVRAVDPRLRALFFFHLLAEGVYLAPRGMVALSLAIGDDEIDRFLQAVTSFLDRYADLLQRRA